MSEKGLKNKEVIANEFEEMYCAHFNKIKSFCNNYLRNEAAAKCVSQEVFVAVWENRENLIFDDRILPYLFLLAKNRCLNLLKKEKVHGSFVNFSRKQMNDCVNYSALKDAAIDKLYSNEVERLFETAMEKLPEKVRSTFWLSRFNDYSYKQIAEIQHISVKTVEYRIMYALRILRIVLKDYLPLLLGWLTIKLF